MTDKSNIQFKKVVLRIPSFPLEKLSEYCNQIDNSLNSIKDEFILTSILLSSPNFFKTLAASEQLSKEKLEKIEITLYKYLSRACTRATPFGLFAGCGVVPISSDINDIIIKDKRFSIGLNSFGASIVVNEFNSSIDSKFYSNNTTYIIDDDIIFLQANKDSSGKKNFSNIILEKNEILEKVLKYCKNGKLKKEIIKYLIHQFSCSYEDSEEYVDNLIQEQVLLPEIQNNGYKYSSLNNLIKEHQENIYTLKDLLNQQDFTDLNSVKHSNINLKHVNTYFDFKGSIPNRVLEDIKEVEPILDRIINFGIPNTDTRLTKFKKQFTKRFDTQTIAVLRALNKDYGVGYGIVNHNYSNDIFIRNFPFIDESNSLEFNNIESNLCSKIINCLLNKEHSIDLSKFFKKYPTSIEQQSLNPYKVYKASLYRDGNENRYFIERINYDSLRKVTGRFTDSDEIRDLFKEIIEIDKNENLIFAEVIHLPSDDVGNIINREVDFDYYITYYDGNTIESNKKIRLDDLYISIIDDKVFLFSKKLRKRIIPTFSNAYNTNNSSNTAILEFLLDVSNDYFSDYLNPAPLDEDKFLKVFNFFPRLEHKNFIFKRCSWLLKIEDFWMENQSLSSAMNDFKENLKKKNIISNFCIIEGDNELYIDINIQLAVKTFLTKLKKNKILKISEALFSQYRSLVKNISGENYNNEFIIPVTNKNKLPKTLSFPDVLSESAIVTRKIYPLLDDWIYIKIYTSYDFADNIIVDLNILLEKYLTKKEIISFFFVKYNDPEFHLRLRINTKNEKIEVLLKIIKFLKEYHFNKISNIKIDTYNREIERYGAGNILFFEKIFFWDSQLSIEIIKNYPDSLILACCKSVLVYFNIFSLELKDQLYFSKQMKDMFHQEFNSTKHTTKYLNSVYLKNENKLEDFVQNKHCTLWNNYFEKFNFYNSDILKLKNNKNFNLYLASLIHMHIIRVVKSDNRKNEYLIYHILFKYLNKIIAKNIRY